MKGCSDPTRHETQLVRGTQMSIEGAQNNVRFQPALIRSGLLGYKSARKLHLQVVKCSYSRPAGVPVSPPSRVYTVLRRLLQIATQQLLFNEAAAVKPRLLLPPRSHVVAAIVFNTRIDPF